MHRRFGLTALMIFLLIAILSGCGGATEPPTAENNTHIGPDGPGSKDSNSANNLPGTDPDAVSFECGDVLAGEVSASERVRDSTSIYAYSYRLNSVEEKAEFSIYDADKELLGTVIVETPESNEARYSDKLRVHLEREGELDVAIYSTIGPLGNGLYLLMEFIVAEKSFHVWLNAASGNVLDTISFAVDKHLVEKTHSFGGDFTLHHESYYVLELSAEKESFDIEQIKPWKEQIDLFTGEEEIALAFLLEILGDTNLRGRTDEHSRFCERLERRSQPLGVDDDSDVNDDVECPWEKYRTQVQELSNSPVADTLRTWRQANCPQAGGFWGPWGPVLDGAFVFGGFFTGAPGAMEGGLALFNWAFSFAKDFAFGTIDAVDMVIKCKECNQACGSSGRRSSCGQSCECHDPEAETGGDPHIQTFDGTGYGFHGTGEYVLVEAVSGEHFRLQIRQEAASASCDGVSMNTALAFELGEHRIAFYSKPTFRTFVDGLEVENLGDAVNLPEGAVIVRSNAQSYHIGFSDGETVHIAVAGEMLNIRVGLPDHRRGQIHGILGTYTGSSHDDFYVRGGAMIPQPMLWDTLYYTFGDSWRLYPGESLFDYAPGESTESFIIPDFPAEQLKLDHIPVESRQWAENVCIDQGVSTAIVMENCIVDVACMEDEMYARWHSGRKEPAHRLQIVETELLLDGDVMMVDAPQSVLAHHREDDRRAILFQEYKNTELTRDLMVDIAEAGRYTADVSLTPDVLADGIEVNVYMLHFDPLRTQSRRVEGEITFSEEILGLIVTSEALTATDGRLGAPGTVYPVGGPRGPELNANDVVTLSESRHGLEFQWSESEHFDQVRIITAAP